MRLQLGDGTSDRTVRLVLIGAGIGVVLFAALQFSGIFGGGGEVERKRQELADAQLMSAIAPELTTARRLLQDDTATAGGTIPSSILEKLKENYAVNVENDEDKKPFANATATALAIDIGVDQELARFILENRDVASLDELNDRKRNLFIEHRVTIEPMIVQRVSQVAASSGIEKLDMIKVEPPRQTRRGQAAKQTPQAAPPRPDPAAGQSLRQKVAAVAKALKEDDATALTASVRAFVDFAESDPTIQRSARSEILKLLEDPSLLETERAQLRLGALATQPSVMLALANIVKAHALDGLSRIPPEPEPEPEGGGNENGAAPPNGEPEDVPPSEGPTPEDFRPPEGFSPENSRRPDDNAEDSETAASDGAENEDASEQDAAEQPNEGAEDAAEDGNTEDAPQPVDDSPIVFGVAPFPRLVALAPPVQRRLLEKLRDNGGSWLTDEDLKQILGVDESDDGNGNGEAESAAEPDGNESGEAETQQPSDAPEAAQASDEQTDASNAPEAPTAGESTDEGADSAEQDEAAQDDHDDSEAAEGEKPAPFAHPDAATIRAYHAQLIELMWRISDVVQRTRPKPGSIYTGSIQFKANMDQTVKFIYEIEKQFPWIQVTGIQVGIDNADEPKLSITLGMKATIL